MKKSYLRNVVNEAYVTGMPKKKFSIGDTVFKADSDQGDNKEYVVVGRESNEHRDELLWIFPITSDVANARAERVHISEVN